MSGIPGLPDYTNGWFNDNVMASSRPWSHVHAVRGDNFEALGVASGGQVSTVPDEVPSYRDQFSGQTIVDPLTLTWGTHWETILGVPTLVTANQLFLQPIAEMNGELAFQITRETTNSLIAPGGSLSTGSFNIGDERDLWICMILSYPEVLGSQQWMMGCGDGLGATGPVSDPNNWKPALSHTSGGAFRSEGPTGDAWTSAGISLQTHYGISDPVIWLTRQQSIVGVTPARGAWYVDDVTVIPDTTETGTPDFSPYFNLTYGHLTEAPRGETGFSMNVPFFGLLVGADPREQWWWPGFVQWSNLTYNTQWGFR